MSEFRTFKLVEDYAEVKNEKEIDMIVIDVNNGIFNVQKLIEDSETLTMIFIEGHHLAHRLNISRSLLKSKRRQRFVDLRPERGQKGCAYFEVGETNVKLTVFIIIDFVRIYSPLKLSHLAIKVRTFVGKVLHVLEIIPGVKKIRGIWLGKIPWNF